MDDDERDGLDIQSLSMGEAEFMYDAEDTAGATSSSDNATKKTINLDAFNIIKVIGKGSFGKVFLVRHKARGSLHAMKVLKKDYIIKKNQVEHTKTERAVLGYIRHPFIVGLTMAFQTKDKLFFVLDYCAGKLHLPPAPHHESPPHSTAGRTLGATVGLIFRET